MKRLKKANIARTMKNECRWKSCTWKSSLAARTWNTLYGVRMLRVDGRIQIGGDSGTAYINRTNFYKFIFILYGIYCFEFEFNFRIILRGKKAPGRRPYMMDCTLIMMCWPLISHNNSNASKYGQWMNSNWIFCVMRGVSWCPYTIRCERFVFVDDVVAPVMDSRCAWTIDTFVTTQ